MNIINNIVISFFILINTQGLLFADTWDEIIRKDIDENYGKIKYSTTLTKQEIIVRSFIEGKNKVIQNIEGFLETKYDSILISLYISKQLKNSSIDSLLLKKINSFYNNERTNVSCYYLSYYYNLIGELRLCKEYLIEGNKKNNPLTSSKLKTIIYDFIIKNTQSELCAYSLASFNIDVNKYMIFRQLSRKLLMEDPENQSIITEFGKNIERNSSTIYGKQIGLAIQIESLSKNRDKEMIESLERKKKTVWELPQKIKRESSSREELLSYLKSVYLYGEYITLKNQPPGNSTIQNY